MALNKFMHPRNIYKNPPDFAELAKLYDEFAKIAKMDVTGKVSIEFKDPCALRVLTKCLLKKDFNLDVVIPEDRLVPTLPLRLNYILWVEDLLNTIGIKDDIDGLDIGTGACAVYPLLIATKNKWHMVGTESDVESLAKAKENVARNNLEKLIELRKSPSKSLLEHLFADDASKKFHFSMCNPPFYSNMQELCESRSPARPQPKNAFTGSPQELITDGGELTFCRQMIEESKKLQDNIIIFTTMVGHKYNLKELEQDLKAEGIKFTTTEFCQGRVTRWGLAWTYQHIDIWKLVPPRDSKSRKPSAPIVYSLPEIAGTIYDTENVTKKIKSILESLNITFKVINKRGQYLAVDILAMRNTWTNQRRKRRQMKLLAENDSKKSKLDCEDVTEPVREQTNNVHKAECIQRIDKGSDVKQVNIEHKATENMQSIDEGSDVKNLNNVKNAESIQSIDEGSQVNQVNNVHKATEVIQSIVKGNQEVNDQQSSHDDSKQSNSVSQSAVDLADSCVEAKNIEDHKGISEKAEQISNNNNFDKKASSAWTTLNSTDAEQPVTHAILKILKKQTEIFMEMEFLDGSAGKEGVHQIVQYIKNNWK